MTESSEQEMYRARSVAELESRRGHLEDAEAVETARKAMAK